MSVQVIRKRQQRRRGNVAVLCAFFMVGLMAMIAFAVDLGYIFVARDQIQRAADASALAAAWELIDEEGPQGDGDVLQMMASANSVAREYAAYNEVLTSAPKLGNSDVAVGYIENPFDPACPLTFTGDGQPNAVRVRVRRTSTQNGNIPLFFARTLGIDSTSAQAEATAVLINSVGGWRMPSDGTNLQILPFALDEDTWRALIDSGVGNDQWKWNPDTKKVVAGIDDIKEVNLYPQGTGSPGNRGTVDIGGSNNSTNDIARQIVEGISEEDLQHFEDHEIKFDDNGKLYLNGDTGISAGVKDELASIIGQPRIIPIFRLVEGPGNNATYTIVEFAGVRIMDVKLTGSMSSKRVIIQPCNIVAKGGIPTPGQQTSTFVYSPVWLVR
jgi:Flp pilus assembly protein TadG